MPPVAPPDFSAIGEAFTSAVQYIRDMGVDNLDDVAIVWFKTSCGTLMRRLQSEFVALQRMTQQLSPAQYPDYVVNPTKPLFLTTDRLPEILTLYIPQFEELFHLLLQKCGFEKVSVRYGYCENFCVEIYFSAQQRTGTAKPAKKLDIGNFFDEFSSLETLAEGVNRLRIKDANVADDDAKTRKNEESEDNNTEPGSDEHELK